MASNTISPPLTGYNPVLVLLPPREYMHRIDPFRRIHDKSGVRWPAHITLNFVEQERLAETITTLRGLLKDIQPFKLPLDKVDSFPMNGYDTVHLTIAQPEDQENVQQLSKILSAAVGYRGRSFTPHLTLGQAPNRNGLEALQLLHVKAQQILSNIKDLEWNVGSVVVLERDETNGGVMKFFDEIFLGTHTESAYDVPSQFPTAYLTPEGSWTCVDTLSRKATLPSTLSVATYNILHDSEFPFADRSDRIIKEITDVNADILCLQEVSDEALKAVLGSPLVQSLYKFSSQDPMVTLENERNLLVLSRYPFSYIPLDTGSKHKPACIANFISEGNESPSLVVACVHLTAGRAASPMEQKTRELAKVVEHLTKSHANSDWIIAGDLNWPNEGSSTPADGLFVDVGATSGDPTYEPIRNALAAKTARESTSGQRYDRVYLKRNSSWAMQDVGTFAVGVEPASDHWGLKVSLQREGDLAGPTAARDQKYVAESSNHLPPPSIPTKDLNSVLQAEGWLPSSDREEKMQWALNLVRAVLCPTPNTPLVDVEATQAKPAPRVIIRLEAVGSYGLGVHCSTSDIDCLAIGNISPKTFWMLARSKIRSHLMKNQAEGGREVVQLKRFVKDAAVQMMELDVSGIKVDLQYCAAAGLAEHWDKLTQLQADSPYFSLPHSSLVTLNAYRDLLTLKNIIPSLEQFRLAHRSLKLFLTRRGLWGARFGYLGGFHLTLLLTRVALSLPNTAQASHLIEAFLKTYAGWDWGKDVVYPIPSRAPDVNSTSTYKRVLSKEPMVVLSIQRPLCNLTFHASSNSVQSLSRGFQQAQAALEQGQSWLNLCGIQEDDESGDRTPLGEFISSHRSFVKLDVHFWGGNDMSGRALIGWLESRIVNLLVQLHQNVPELTARFWPERLADRSTIDSDARDPNGFYLFGLSPSNSSIAGGLNGDRPARRGSDIQSALLSCLRTFEHTLRSNERFYDEKETFISINCLKQSQLPSEVLLDPFRWSDNGIDGTLDDEEDEEESSELPVTEDGATTPTDSWDEFKASSSSQRKRAAAAAAKARSTPHIPAGKLRTSADVYNRLIWDSTGDVTKDGYTIGYEDRFKGIKEMPLTSWKREVEDESFIPFHRVVYFKRLVDGVNVWDRRTKLDLVFGSGASLGSS